MHPPAKNVGPEDSRKMFECGQDLDLVCSTPGIDESGCLRPTDSACVEPANDAEAEGAISRPLHARRCIVHYKLHQNGEDVQG